MGQTVFVPNGGGGGGGSGQIADFIYDASAGASIGNLYNTFEGVVDAANALGCNCRVYVRADSTGDATLTAGANKHGLQHCHSTERDRNGDLRPYISALARLALLIETRFL